MKSYMPHRLAQQGMTLSNHEWPFYALRAISAIADLTVCISLRIARPRRSRSAAAYSRQTFPWTICRSVCMYVRTYVRLSIQCNCGKTADRIRMPFGIIGRTGPGMRRVVGFGDRSTGRGYFGANLGRGIVTNGDFTAYVCDSAATRPSSQITLGRLVTFVFVRALLVSLSNVHAARRWTCEQ